MTPTACINELDKMMKNKAIITSYLTEEKQKVSFQIEMTITHSA